MLAKMLNVRGVLTPIQPSNINEETADTIRKACGEQGLWWVLSEDLGANGTMEILAGISSEKDNFPPEATPYDKAWHLMWGFIEAVEKIIETEGIEELGLEGSFLLTVDTDDDPFIVRVIVRDEEVSYQEATLTWDSELRY
jgi:hypothetical protein